MKNKEIVNLINLALEQNNKGYKINAKKYLERATNGMNSKKFNRFTNQGKIISDYWNQAFEQIV
jgi:hypothetical protein